MKVQKLKVFPKLARHYGARKAKRMLAECGTDISDYLDSTTITGCFRFSTSAQGLDFWTKVAYKIGDW